METWRMIEGRTDVTIAIQRTGRVMSKAHAREAVEQFVGDIDRAFALVDAETEELHVYLSISTMRRFPPRDPAT
jgi:hypothetical protein